ncbi:MAG: hypothetical protein Q8K78_19455 [Planctomycetaceae bacterium]|nr:hypothetical protein [Planctomycetaceae bacterium]
MRRNNTARIAVAAVVVWSSVSVLIAEETSAATKTTLPNLMVMTDGRTMTGEITIQAGGYGIEKLGGKLFVPKEQVRCVARDLRDAYRIQRESQTDPSAAALIQLAEWGISYRLYDEARDELHRALRRDPENETARKMLQRLEEQLLAQPKPRTNAPVNSDGFLVQEVESLGGLSKTTAATFTARIQPLLINRCGGASCHSSESNHEFRLSHVRINNQNHRRSAEKNLAVVMKYIDNEDPQQSELLKVGRGPHGGQSVTMFGGSQGADQYRSIQDWVHTVAADHQAEQAKLARQSPLKSKNGRLAAKSKGTPPRRLDDADAVASVATNARDGASSGIVPAGFEDPATPDPYAPPKNELPAGMTLRRANDAFDPEAFNQKFGTSTTTPPRRLR